MIRQAVRESTAKVARVKEPLLTCLRTNSRLGPPPASSDPARAQVSSEANARTAPIRVLRLAQVIDMTGLGKTKIYELQAEGRFPMSVRITEHSVGWVEQEVQAWLASRVADRAALTDNAKHEMLRRPSR